MIQFQNFFLLIELICFFGSKFISASTIWSSDVDLKNIFSWSWSNQNAPFQLYIHGGGGNDKSWYNIQNSPDKVASHLGAKNGISIKINGQSSWNGQTMMRSELIVGGGNQRIDNKGWENGKKYFQYAVKMDKLYPLDGNIEHQLVFFESHSMDLKWGVGSNRNAFSIVFSGGNVAFTATGLPTDWNNFVYEFDFGARSASVYYSSGNQPYRKVINSRPLSQRFPDDLHVGILKLNAGKRNTEQLIYSGLTISTTMPPNPTNAGGSNRMDTSRGSQSIIATNLIDDYPSFDLDDKEKNLDFDRYEGPEYDDDDDGEEFYTRYQPQRRHHQYRNFKRNNYKRRFENQRNGSFESRKFQNVERKLSNIQRQLENLLSQVEHY